MCGIIGFFRHDIPDQSLQRAIDAMHHRGPDGSGRFVDREARVGLGHARLSIIDVQGGAQPLYSESGDLVLVCNGEIYDFERIRADLAARGHRFATRTDSEVIIHLYQEYGMRFLDHLRGEFAFLLYDRGRQELLAVRDRFGIKPLYFHGKDGAYLFASEAKALFATGALRPALDPAAVRDALCGLFPDSIFQGLEVVPPGSCLRVDLRAGRHETIQYWDVDLNERHPGAPVDTLEGAITLVRHEFEEAVRLRLRSDVPLGIYLSGGIDSSVVAATAARLVSHPLKVFTISFPEDDRFNEYRPARELADKVGAEFHSVTCDHAALVENSKDAIWFSELPFNNFHGVGKFMLSALAKKHVSVVLTGEGSDETFLGYDLFRYIDRAPKRDAPAPPKAGTFARRCFDTLGFVPGRELRIVFSRPTQRLVRWFFHARHGHHLRQRDLFDTMRRHLSRGQVESLPPLRRAQYMWIKSALPQYLLAMLGDRPEMAHSVEGRTPFLDHRLFEAARRIKDDLKIHNGTEKYVLREAFKNDLTAEIYSRRKWSFAAPPIWLKKGTHPKLDALMDEHLSPSAVERSGIFNPMMVRLLRLLSKIVFFDGRLKRGLNSMLVFVLTVQILDRMYAQEFDQELASRLP